VKTKELIEKLERFLGSLEKHIALYRDSFSGSRLAKNRKELEEQEHDLARQFGAIESYIRKYSSLQYYDPNTGMTQDPWDSAIAEDLPQRKGPALVRIITELHRIVGQLEATDKESVLLEDLSILFESLKLHPEIIRVSKQGFENGMYADAVLSAFKEVVVRVKEISGLHSLDGTRLMEQAFSPNSPKIKLDDLETQVGKDVQTGFLNIFKGVVLGIRNPKAHINIEQTDPYLTLEYLSLASLLMKYLDRRIEPRE
jgi:uncharacterized protein (TIGR02391 family)